MGFCASIIEITHSIYLNIQLKRLCLSAVIKESSPMPGLFRSRDLSVLLIFVLLFFSHEPPEWPAASWQGHACDVVETHHSAAAQRRSRGPGPHKGLQQLTTAPFQEARLQELLQHLPTLRNTPPLQHTVSAAARA